MKKRKILHLITHTAVGGSQDNTFCTCALHDRARYEVHLASHPGGQWAERARNSCDVFHALPSLVTPMSPGKDLKALLEIFRLLRREKFDLIHTHTAKAGFLGRIAAWLCRVPVIIHTYHAFPFHDFLPAWKRLLFLAMERFVQPMTDFCLTLSERQRQDAAGWGMLRLEKAEVVYTGIDFSKLDQAAAPEETRRLLGVPPGWQLVVTAARLDPAKAPSLLIEAFAEVVKTQPQTQLLIAGDGELRPQVEQRIRDLKLEQHARLLGFRNDVPDLLRAADVFAFSSLSEAMGRAMIEAMLLGRAVVVPAIHGIPEIVRHGDTGLLYEVGDVAALAANMSQLLRNPEQRAQLGEAAGLLTRRLFDVREMVTRIETIYAQQLAARGLALPAALELLPRPAEEARLDAA
jgi:glycosyltransferase involved in cell wall biosynthesis